MRTGRKPNYVRNAGSRTAKLYSKKIARKINRVYLENIKDYDSEEDYDYYDDLKHVSDNSRSRGTVIVAASLIIVILALVLVGLALLKPREVVGNTLQVSTVEHTEQTGNVYEESNPPVIYGVMPIVVYEGHPVTYKQGILVTDDTDDSPVLEIDNSEVDLTVPGSYVVTYIARDKDQNVTREFTTVTVLEGKNIISDEEIDELVDTVLDALITEDMTNEQKCLKVYEYLHAIGYVDEVHSEDWVQNAYWMLKLRRGDCFCYYSAARLLLEKLGFDVMEVRNNNNYVHYWCLVSIDGGKTWWHFDACCWSWGEDGILCLVSDNYLSTFTRRHITSDGRLIHAWDKTNYPATPAEDFWTDQDREVIYEGGLISFDPLYAADDAIWNNNGWDNYYDRLGDLYYNYWDWGYEGEYDYGYDTDLDYDADIEDPSYDAGGDADYDGGYEGDDYVDSDADVDYSDYGDGVYEYDNVEDQIDYYLD